MATGPITQISDVVVPEIFTGYAQQMTEQKSRLIQSGVLVSDPAINNHLAGGGLTFNAPSYKDLDDDEENTSTDDADDRYTGGSNNSTPYKIGTLTEIAVRMSRNNSWSTADLTSALSGDDPQDAIAKLVAGYWTRRLQRVFIATMAGVFADNAAAPVGTEHVAGDLTNDISDAAGAGIFSAGVTNFTAEAFLDATVTMGDSESDLGMMFVHSIVNNRMKKNNLIDFIPDSRGEVTIPMFQGHRVVVDDSMPSTGGVFETWIFGAGAVRFGSGSAKVPTETQRDPDAGNGGGAEILHNRVEWCLHPAGHAYVGTAADGGPTNAATANNLANAGSWERRFTERKQIKIARLITRES